MSLWPCDERTNRKCVEFVWVRPHPSHLKPHLRHLQYAKIHASLIKLFFVYEQIIIRVLDKLMRYPDLPLNK